jgi:hypothetical protein
LIRDGAVAYAASKGCRYVTCGHTHLPVIEEVGAMLYANSGTWTEHPPCPFVSVKGGEIGLEYWPTACAEAAPSAHTEEGTSGRAPARTLDREAPRLSESPELIAFGS